MTRIYTDKEEAQGGAWAGQVALPNQTLWQASLPTRMFLNRSIRSANGPAFRALREIMRIEKDIGLPIGLPSGEMFWECICKLACVCLYKTSPAFVQRINPGVFGATNWFVHIRVNPCYPWLKNASFWTDYPASALGAL